jgi:Zn-dependent protease with chaperone function
VRRLDTANRSFFVLLGVALGPYLLLGLFGCGILSVAGYRYATQGSPGLNAPAWPALGFLAITATGTVFGLLSLWRQRRATLRLAAFVQRHRLPLDDTVAGAAAREGVARIDVVDTDDPFSFTYGLLAPRVAVSRALVDGVDEEELQAVLVHERYHVRNLDPLKVVVARAVPSAFFFLPALRHLLHRYLAGRELAADRSAMRACGRGPLAAALYKVVAGPSSVSLGAAAAIGGPELLDVRLAQLEAGNEPPLPAIPRLSLAMTAAGVALMAAGLTFTVVLIGGAMPMNGSPMNSPLDVVGGVLCGGVWVVAAVALYRRLGGRHSSPTT